ncbi:dsRNA-gated channel SID-1 family protein [Acanthocheilonema viteae]
MFITKVSLISWNDRIFLEIAGLHYCVQYCMSIIIRNGSTANYPSYYNAYTAGYFIYYISCKVINGETISTHASVYAIASFLLWIAAFYFFNRGKNGWALTVALSLKNAYCSNISIITIFGILFLH